MTTLNGFLLWFSWFHLVRQHQTITFLITIFRSCSTTRFYMGVVKFKWNNFLQYSWCRRNENTSENKNEREQKMLPFSLSFVYFFLSDFQLSFRYLGNNLLYIRRIIHISRIMLFSWLLRRIKQSENDRLASFRLFA